MTGSPKKKQNGITRQASEKKQGCQNIPIKPKTAKVPHKDQ